MSNDRLVLVAAKVELGLGLAEDLISVARDALEDGCDSHSLRILAGLTKAEFHEAWPLFDRALGELKIPKPSKLDAVMSLAREEARGILNKSTSPYRGAKKIWALSLRLPGDRIPELDPFVYAASEWEDRPEDRRFFEEGIWNAAKEVLTRNS